MFGFEKRFLNFCQKHIVIIGGVLVFIVSILMRYPLRTIQNMDTWSALIPWHEMLREHGLRFVLQNRITDYNVAYIVLLWLSTFLPFHPLSSIKFVSACFDYMLAAALVYMLLILLKDEKIPSTKIKIVTSFSLFIMLPLMILNSTAWGQCDAIYTTFIALSLCFVLKDKYPLALLMFAVSICFKLQALFFLPVLIILYVVKKKFSILYFGFTPIMLIAVGMLGTKTWREWGYGITVYLDQTGLYKRLTLNYPNFPTFFFVPEDVENSFYNVLSPFFMMITLAIFMCALFYILHKKMNISGQNILLLTVWSVLTCTNFLPSMHERYGYMAEVFIWVYFMMKPSLKRFIVALAVNVVPFFMYVSYLFDITAFGRTGESFIGGGVQMLLAALNLAAYGLVTYIFFNGLKAEKLAKDSAE